MYLCRRNTIVADNQLQVTVTNLDPTAPPYLCAANGTTLTADVIPNDPTQTYLWEWIKDTTYAVGFSQNLTVLDSGIYHVEVVNENGCRYESTPIYIEDRRPVVSYTSSHPNNTVCAGQDLELNFSATPSSSFDFYGTTFNAGATGNPYVKNASPITNCNTCVISTNLSQTGNGGGTYIMQATSGNGCVTEEIITVTVNELPSFTVTTPIEYCQFGAPDELFIETQFTNFTGTGTAPGASQGSYAPRWYSAPDSSAFIGNSPKPSTDSVGIRRYYVQVENTTTGCLSTYDFVDVEILQSPVQPTLTSPLIACENASRIPAVSNLNDVNSDYNILKTITLSSNVNALSAAQGSGNYRTLWFEADTATEIDLTVSQNKIIPNLSVPDTLLYFVSQFSILTTENGCPSKKLAVPVYVAAKPSFTILSENGQFSVCRNDSLELSIQTPFNGTTYEWIEQQGVPGIPGAYPYTYAGPTGTTYLAHSNNANYEVYWVRAVDSNQCYAQKSVTVNQIALPENPTGYLPTDLDYCFGATSQELQVSTEVGSLTALWYNNTTNAFLGDSIVPNTTVAPSTSTGNSFTTTTYKFKLKDQLTGCVSAGFRSVDVAIHQLPDAPIIANDWTECFNADMAGVSPISSTLLTTVGLTTKWYDSDTNLLSGGNYLPSSLRTDTSIYYVSSIGAGPMFCESNLSEVLAYTRPLPEVDLSFSDPDGLICFGQEFEVFVLPDTTNANWDYTWRNISSGTPTIEQLDGTYFTKNIVQYESFELLLDDGQCQNSMYFDVDVYPEITPPTAPALPAAEFCQNDTSTLQFAPTLPGYTIQWLDAFGNVFASNPVAANETIGDVTYQVRHLDTVTGCFSDAVPFVVNVKGRPATPNLVQDWMACLGDLNPDAIQEGVHYELPVGANYSLRIYDGDSLTILSQFPQPSTNLVDTTVFYLSTLLSYPNLQCESAESVALRAITRPLPNTAVAISDSDQVVCIDQILTLSVNDTVGSGNTYVWSVDDNQDGIFAALGNGLQRTFTASNAGPYQFRVLTTDLFGCEAFDYVNITTHAAVIAPTTFTLEYCFEEDSSRMVAPYNLPTHYRLVWLDSNQQRFSNNPWAPVWAEPQVGAAFAGVSYAVQHQDTLTGCYSEESSAFVEVYGRPDNPVLVREWFDCFNNPSPTAINSGLDKLGNPAPNVTVNVASGDQIHWYDIDTNTALLNAPTPSATRGDTVYYFARAYNADQGCESRSFTAIPAYTTPLPKPNLIVSDTDRVVCLEDNFTLTANDPINYGWDYVWMDAATAATLGTGMQYTGLFTAGNQGPREFELRTTDSIGCVSRTFVNMSSHPLVTAPASFINEYCYNEDSTRISPNYGPNTIPAGYKLTWLDSNHNRLPKAPYAPTWLQPNNSSVLEVSYLIEFKDTITGCYSEEVGVTARIRSLPPDPILLRDWAACYAEPNPLAINGDPLRPQFAVVGGNTFKWIGLDSTTVLNTAPIPSTLRKDTVHYFVRTVSNINSRCESANMVAIQAYTFPLPQPIVSVSDSDFVVCRGEAIEFEVTDTTSNGWQYQWTKFDARVSPPIPAVPAVPGQGLLYQDSVTYNTQYELRTTDTNSCFTKKIWNITKADYPIVDSIIVKDITCYNQDDGEITIFSRFGQSIKYSLDSGATYTYRAKDTALEKGWYYVDVVDNFSNCPTIYHANDRRVYVHEPLPLQIDTVITQDITCFGLLDGQMQIMASGGYILDSTLFNYQRPEKLYSIDAGATFYQNDSLPGSTSSGMVNLASGLYQIRVENVNGCEAINNQNYTITLKQPDLAYIDTIIVTPISCYNQTDGTIDVRAFGGNSLTYSIDSVQYFPNGVFNNLGSQAFFLEVVDSLGCPITPNSQSDSIWVSEPAPLTVNPIVNQLLCYHDSTGLIELNIFGGNPNFQSFQHGYNIDWDVDTSSLSIPINSSYYLPKNDSIYGLIAGTYYANIVDFKGCGIVVPIQVNEPDPVEVNSITISPLSCYGSADGKVLVNAYGGNYLEFELNGSTVWQNNPLFSGLNSDTTYISVRDSNACEVTYNTITKNFVPQPDSAYVDTIIAHNIKCFSDSTGSILIHAFGGNTLTYTIDSVLTATTFYPGLVADTFYVQVIDSKNCPVNYMNNDSTIILTEPPLLDMESNLVQGVTCYYDTTGQIGHFITGGVLPHTLVLNGLDTLTSTSLTTQLYGGPWYFTSYDANGCKDSSLVYIPTSDYDCDSIPNNVEGNTDFDFDGTPNMMDHDSDGDGIADIIERDYNRDGIVYDDCDNDGWPDYLDVDQCNFFIPNIVTPNGDGDNDYFVIPDLDKYPNNRLSIYDRLGNMVFQETSYVNTFQGIANRSSALSTSNGQLPIGTYFYIVEVNGIPFQSGYIYIMR